MSQHEDVSILSSRKRREQKAVSSPESKEQEPSQEMPQDVQEPLVAPKLADEPLPVIDGITDEHGNMVGDDVFYWLPHEHKPEALVPQPAKILELRTDGTWSGHRYRPIAQGVLAIFVMRYSDVPKVGYFTKRSRG